ncbi:hypothetical protein BC832DRAFT_534000 [Gaertneriomyces semiglobifer]|nr:hypothetical protein BC832DRAFT_534000 [Gaertneriomyces semiglobifer]
MSRSSFLPVSPDSDFPIDNIPFGVISTETDGIPRCASAIGEFALDLSALAEAGGFTGPFLGQGVAERVFSKPALNEFMSLGRPAWREARSFIQDLLSDDLPSILRGSQELQRRCLIPLSDIRFHLPAEIGDYTDFYASKEHASNVGTMFRGKDNALMPNWVHLPVGYHGRASSIVVSGTPLQRPCGLFKAPDGEAPVFGPSRKVDFELEVAAFVGTGNALGTPVTVSEAENHIFGLVLMNDWSARDIQQYEYVPLGPFLGKNFGTTISPWIVTLDALEPFRVAQPQQASSPTPASYLNGGDLDAYDIHLQVAIKAQNATAEAVISSSNLKYMYWSFRQMLAHHTINGCNMRPGDLCGSGTISGPTRESLGSLLEMSYNGKEPLHIDNGMQRSFLEDGDQITLRGFCYKELPNGRSIRLGFGQATGSILSA